MTAAIVVAAAVAVALGGAYLMGWRPSHPPATASCVVDNAIDVAVRRNLDQTALKFVDIVSGINPVAAYDMLTAESKSAFSPDRFVATLRPSLEPVEPFSNVHVAHAYFVRAPEGGTVQRVICGSQDQPDHWVAVTARPGPVQAHLVVEADAKGGRWAFVLWLVREADWHVQGFHFTAVGMAGKSARQILDLARAEHDRHHDFNAILLYGAATHLMARGNDFQLGIEPEAENEMAKLPVPAYLQGKPPLGWKFGDHIYRIDNVGAAGVGDKLYLAITQQLTPWTNDQDADTANRALIADLAKTLPEYADVFSGLIVVARDESGAHLYRTVAAKQPVAKPAAK